MFDAMGERERLPISRSALDRQPAQRPVIMHLTHGACAVKFIVWTIHRASRIPLPRRQSPW
jgi:hypothetical protein